MTDAEGAKIFTLRASMLVAPVGEGKVAQQFALQLERPMSTADVWDLLTGALAVVYRNTLERQGLQESDFVDQTLDKLQVVLRAKDIQTPTVQ
jgi:hypothetical protein